MTSLERLFLALLGAATLSLAGCASDDPGDPNYNSVAASQIGDQNLRSSEHNRCLVLGTEPGTDAYVYCMATLAASDAQIRQVSSDAERAREQATLRNAASSRSATCRTTFVGSAAHTSCF